MRKTKVLISIALVACTLLFASCGSIMLPTQPDPSTGLIKEAAVQATVLVDKPFDMATHKDFAFVPGDFSFAVEQTKKIEFFREVYDQDAFDRMIIRKGLADKLQSTTSPVGWNRAYETLGPFVVVRFALRGNPPKNEFIKLQVLDPKSADIVFEAEVHMDYIWKGINDKYTFYPLFNELIKWLKKNDRKLNQSLEPTPTSGVAQP